MTAAQRVAQARESRAAKRQRQHCADLHRADDQRLSVCEALSVSGPTRLAYQHAVKAFESWAAGGHLRLPTLSVSSLDLALVKYMDFLFGGGHRALLARNALHGLIFTRSMPRDKFSLPRARRALAGYLKSQPPGVRDPLPWEGALLLTEWLLTPPFSESRVLAGCALAVQFDMYMRPGEILDVVAEAVVRPAGPYKPWGIVVAPRDCGSRKPAKHAEFDDAIFVGVATAPRQIAAFVLTQVVKLAPTGSGKLFQPLTVASYGRLFRRAALATNLSALRTTPHSVRHGGPSDDMYFDRTSLKEVARRGRWHCLQSVRRCEKRGRGRCRG